MESRSTGGGLRVTRWVMVVVGGIAAIVGLFILLAGDDQYVGIGGDVSWRVGDLDPLWGWGLLVMGAASLVIGLVFLRARSGRASSTGGSGADLAAHAVVFLLVNGFLWIQDLALGGGLNYVWWVTIPWGIGLAAHALTYVRRR